MQRAVSFGSNNMMTPSVFLNNKRQNQPVFMQQSDVMYKPGKLSNQASLLPKLNLQFSN